MTAHVVQRLLVAEELVRRRRAGEQQRQVSSQRAARIDPNPHQIDAVVFALGRLPEGGCILADEVGLGKTIEAGLVIAQLRAEGARRVLVVTPKSLLGQWRQELAALFEIDAREVRREAPALDGEGVFLATRDFVGSERGAAALRAHERFELCVVDEAHEVFAGIYRRYDREGAIRVDAPRAQMASRLSGVLRAAATPVLLLTATPIQNSLLELWGLVHYVDPTGTLLGSLATFRALFCPGDERILADGQAHELQRRLGTVLRRTLRRQAEEFMRTPFTRRRARLFEYTMSAEERALYDDVTAYLLEPGIYAFAGDQRQLLLIGFHRRMASSLSALTRSLEHVAERLRRLRQGRPDPAADRESVAEDLEDDEGPEAAVGEAAPPAPGPAAGAAIAAELARVEGFIARARALPTDSKAKALVTAIQLAARQGEQGGGSGKVVVFTEYRATQDYLYSLLIESGVPDQEITLFRAVNDSPRARAALARWRREVGADGGEGRELSPEVAARLALVHELRHHSRIFISTEAGAKGLNLQFCDTVINYDLPWNPQRVEQRIGRCHRYGQTRDVTVVSFLATDNEAQRLTYEILSQKLELFGAVLGATDEVLSGGGADEAAAPEALASAVGGELEAALRRIYERARSLDEIARELRELREAMVSRRRDFEAAQRRAEEIIQRRFDAAVRAGLRRIQDELPRELAQLDRQLEEVVRGFLERAQIPHAIHPRGEARVLEVGASPRLPAGLRDGARCVIGRPPAAEQAGALHLGHPLVSAAIDEIRAAAAARRYALAVHADAPEIAPLRGRRGRVRVFRAVCRGFEVVEEIVPVVVVDPAAGPLPVGVARALLAGAIRELPAALEVPHVTDADLDDARDELVFLQLAEAAAADASRFARITEQIERSLADRIMLLTGQRDAARERLARAGRDRDAAIGPGSRARAEQQLRGAEADLEQIEAALARLAAGDDDAYRRWRADARARRFARPELHQLFDAEIEIG